MSVKILLDTDIGTDIDDAVCLAYLLANPDCELLGVTTVSGEAEKRAQMVSALCRVAGQDIPIFPGAEAPLLIPQRQTHAPQAAALGRWNHQSRFPHGEAVSFLRETIRGQPGQVTLLTIGPLTNVALLFAIDPDIPALLEGLVMMCGAFTDPKPEWNAQLDPHATAIVYRHAPPLHRSIGLDVTTQVVMEAEVVWRRFQAPLLRPVLDFAEVWFQSRDIITFHDPLAAATCFDLELCRFQAGRVDVELADPERLGATHWTLGAGEVRHEVALEVDASRFFEHYFSMF